MIRYSPRQNRYVLWKLNIKKRLIREFRPLTFHEIMVKGAMTEGRNEMNGAVGLSV